MPFEDQHTRIRATAQVAAGIDLEHVRVVDLLDAWNYAEATAALALKHWTSAPDDERGDAFAAYRAALDREEQAAAVLERALAGKRGLRYATWLAHLA
jgi:hypothetical protein